MLIQIFILIIILGISGLYSCCEMAYFSLNKYKLKEDIKKNNKDAIRVNKLLSNSNKFLSTIQVVITFSSFLASAFASSTFVEKILSNINIDNYKFYSNLFTVVITMIMSYFSLVFSELLPKKMGLSNPEKIAYKTSKLLSITMIIFYPFVFILTKSVDLLTKIFNIKEKNEDKLTEEKIKKFINIGKNEGILEKKETEILMNVYKFNDIEASKIMTDVKDIKYINLNDDINEIMKVIKVNKFTRFPVLKDDQLIDVLNVKDLIINYNNKKDFIDIVREPYFLDKTTKIDDVFNYMKDRNLGLIFIGSKDNIIGIVTMEDIIEEILGNIYDEYN